MKAVNFLSGLFLILLVLFPVALSVYGIILAFKASIIVGIVALLVEPTPFILGLVMFFAHVDLAHKLALALGL